MTTYKQDRVLAYVAAHPGCSTADVHRDVGIYYAHGHHKFTYETVGRMLRSKGRAKQLLVAGPSNGNTGSLYTVESYRAAMAVANLVAGL